MSIFDEFRALTGELFDAFDAPEVTITRTTTQPQIAADRAAGRKGATITETVIGKGVLGKRSLKLEDGTIVQQSVARLSIPAEPNDRLTIGNQHFEIIETEEIAPDGGSPFVTIAVLK
jgi:hypothetical protein